MSKKYQGSRGRFSAIPQKFGGSGWRQNTMFSSLYSGPSSKNFFLGELGAGSGANNHIDFDDNIILFGKKLKLVRASSQGASITNALQTGLGFTGDFAVQVPVNLASLTGDFDILDKWDGTGNQRSYIVRIVGGSAVYLYLSADGAAVGSASVSYQFVVGTEVDVTVKYTAATGTMKLLINGVSVGTATGTLPTSIFSSTAPVSIGILSTASTNAFDGTMERMYIYDDDVADATILANVTAATPSATNLVAHLKFANSLVDETANNNDFTAINAPTYTGAFSIGWEGYVTDQEQRTSICSNQTLGNSGAISFYNTSRFLFTDDAGDTDVLTHTANFEDTVGYIELVRDDDNLVTAYYNGTSVGTATVDGEFVINRIMGGADNSSSSYGYSGGMRNFKIYSRLLSEAERTTNMNGGHVSDGCELWYRCNETSGSTVIDYSGNERTGTIENNGTYFFQTVKSFTNLFSNSGFDSWAGAFPDESPVGWTNSGVETSENYLSDSGGRIFMVSDTSNLGISQTGVLTAGRNYKAILNIQDIYATTLLTGTNTPSNGDTITIGSTVYTAKTTLASAYDVLIGANLASFLDNLKSAINATAGEGTTYGTGTLVHPDVEATANSDTTQVIVAKVIGDAGLAIATTETSGVLSFTSTTMGHGTVYFYSMSGVTSLVMNPVTVVKGQNVWELTAGSTSSLGFLRGPGSFPEKLIIDNYMLFEM